MAENTSPSRDEDVALSGDEIEVRLPATTAYVSLLRTLTATLAARARFTVDEIEDLRIAVDEACAMLVPHALPGASMTCRFSLSEDSLAVTSTVPASNPAVPDRSGFGWMVLSALAGGADAGFDNGTLWIRLHKQAQFSPATPAS